MALVIGVPENEDFYVGDTRCTVEAMRDEQHFRIRVHGSFIENVFDVSAAARVEILPDVWVSAGPIRKGLASLAIEAPKRIRILRRKLYERSGPPA